MNDLIKRQDAIDAIKVRVRKKDGNQTWLNEYENGWNDALEEIESDIEHLLSVNQWIPCDERLPEKDEYVLIYLFGNQPYLAWLDGSEWHTDDFKIDEEDIPIAWMPLPESYKKGES